MHEDYSLIKSIKKEFGNHIYKNNVLDKKKLSQTIFSNNNNLIKFIDLRTHVGAQWEIQQAAAACLEIATKLFPETVGAYREIKSEEV